MVSSHGVLDLTASRRARRPQAFSVHSYGKTGLGLGQLGTTFVPWIASNRSRLSGDPTVLPYAVTEHAPHTTALWNTVATTGDVCYEASRLGSQILFNVRSAASAPPAFGRFELPGRSVP